MNHKYHQIVVLGAGESGCGAAILAKKQGLEVFVSDGGKIKEKFKQFLLENTIPHEELQHTEKRILQADLVVKSPGIPEEVAIIQEIRKAGIDLVSEIEFASWFTDAFLVAVTGTNGKTTTTSLLGHIMKNAGLDVCVAGNIGRSFAAALAECDHAYFVLEISSFQLDDIVDFRPDIAVLLNITRNHLDRYQNNFEAYTASKMRIIKNQTAENCLVFNADDALIQSELAKHPAKAKLFPISIEKEIKTQGAFVSNNLIHINVNQTKFNMTIEQLALQGRHNTSNSMAAGVPAKLLDIRNESLKQSLSDFQNIAHRIEYVANVHGVSYYNDSKATTVNATWYAFEDMTKPVVWIAGGIDKGNDYSILLPLVRDKVRALVCLGRDNKKLIKAFAPHIEHIAEADNVNQAVTIASVLAQKGDVVLLSPTCSSFDLFESYEDRGNQFKAAVNAL
ncbi:MAG: UDP-N-acetylmuramoyl-L-alanine--D-glutamate ligase [Bacteroidales bacterium]|nr:UDP-N-acetylmuramoyl-L-alanine--D-glutamate ligase [Bacteroidales bacterium]